jgi:hypothetical protein
MSTGHIGDRRPIVQHLEHGLIALFHDAELHDHPTTPSIETDQRSVTEKADRDRQVSASYRSHCRPATGTASRNCHPPTEATVSTMNRNSTPVLSAAIRTLFARAGLRGRTCRTLWPLTCAYLRAGDGNRTRIACLEGRDSSH